MKTDEDCVRAFHLSFFVFLVCAAVPASAQGPPASAARHAPARSEQSVPFAVGETLVYDVSWASVIAAGQATLAVKERAEAGGSVAYHLVADGRPGAIVSRLYTLYYRVESWLNPSTLLPRRASTFTEEGRRTRLMVTTFDQRNHKAVYENGGARRTLNVPPLTQDPLGALYVLRTLRVDPGTRLSMPIVNNGELHRATLTTAGRETIECGLGTVQTVRVDMKVTDAAGQPVGRDMALWLTTGRRQVPVQLRAELPIGSFRLVLREASGL